MTRAAVPSVFTLLLLLAACAPGLNGGPGNATVTECNAKKCTIDVEARLEGSACKVTLPGPNDQLVVKGRQAPTPNTDVIIIWKLPDNFRFCGNDGVQWKRQADQFSENFATDDANGERDTGHGQCKKHYRWKDGNTQAGRWDYQLLFRERTLGTPCALDPWVLNQ